MQGLVPSSLSNQGILHSSLYNQVSLDGITYYIFSPESIILGQECNVLVGQKKITCPIGFSLFSFTDNV